MTVAVIVPILPAPVEIIATALFALSGALLAARLKQTFVTASFFALVTGVGGGTVRDALLNVPAFWLRDPWIAPAILVTALVAWFTPHRWWEGKLLEWADAAGLAMFTVIGTTKALSLGVAPVPAAILGIVTGCAGGIIRDVVAGVPSIIMRPEIYVTAAALCAGLTVSLHAMGVDEIVAWSLAALAGFILRGAAMTWNIKLPAYSRE